MRVYFKRLYIVAMPQGISGFPKPSIPAIVTGAVLKRDLLRPWTGKRLNISAHQWRCQDGHLPEFQPVMSLTEACAWLDQHPTEAIYPVGF